MPYNDCAVKLGFYERTLATKQFKKTVLPFLAVFTCLLYNYGWCTRYILIAVIIRKKYREPALRCTKRYLKWISWSRLEWARAQKNILSNAVLVDRSKKFLIYLVLRNTPLRSRCGRNRCSARHFQRNCWCWRLCNWILHRTRAATSCYYRKNFLFLFLRKWQRAPRSLGDGRKRQVRRRLR